MHQPRRRRNRGARIVVPSNSDIEAAEGCIAALRDFADAHPRCGIAAPELRDPDGRRQPSRRSFPTVRGTIVRRTPLRRSLKPQQRQRRHYLLDEHPTVPTPSDWLLGAFLFLRREMLEELGGFDEGYRLYGEEIDLAYRARRAGWERWYVPQAVAIHHHQAVTDKRFFTRRTLWHWRSIARFVRKHPESLRALVEIAMMGEVQAVERFDPARCRRPAARGRALARYTLGGRARGGQARPRRRLRHGLRQRAARAVGRGRGRRRRHRRRDGREAGRAAPRVGHVRGGRRPALPAALGDFDVVVCFEVLEHLDDAEQPP